MVGAESPPFRALSAEAIAAQDARIRDSGANIVWVGLGTPNRTGKAARRAGVVALRSAGGRGAVRDSGATIVWVGLGTPKQDWEVARLTASVPVAMAVGAAFDFLAGVKPQAPLWMQKSGTEWAFRFASEPRRLAKRYLWGNPRFLVAAAREPGLRRGVRR